MRFAVFALIFGCSALACKYAVQSKPFAAVSTAADQIDEVSSVQSALLRIGFDFFKPRRPVLFTPPITVEAPRKLNLEETLGLIQTSAVKHRVPVSFVRSIVQA